MVGVSLIAHASGWFNRQHTRVEMCLLRFDRCCDEMLTRWFRELLFEYLVKSEQWLLIALFDFFWVTLNTRKYLAKLIVNRSLKKLTYFEKCRKNYFTFGQTLLYLSCDLCKTKIIMKKKIVSLKTVNITDGQRSFQGISSTLRSECWRNSINTCIFFSCCYLFIDVSIENSR